MYSKSNAVIKNIPVLVKAIIAPIRYPNIFVIGVTVYDAWLSCSEVIGL